MKHKTGFQLLFAGLSRRQTLPAPGRESKTKGSESCCRKPEIKNSYTMKTKIHSTVLLNVPALLARATHKMSGGASKSRFLSPITAPARWSLHEPGRFRQSGLSLNPQQD